MPAARPPGPYPIDEAIDMETWLVRFDERGVCVSPETRFALLAKLDADREQDVIFMSHGWKTDFGGALEQYGAFLKAFEQVLGAHPKPGFKPLFVGVTWPSRWLATNPGPVMAAADPTAADAAQAEVDEIVSGIGASLPPEDAERLYALLEKRTLDVGAAQELATLGLRALNASELDPESGGERPDPDALVAGWQRLSALGGPAAEPNLDDVGAVGGGGAEVTAAGGGFDPLDFIRLFSIFLMKDRAAVVGANGVAKLLTALTQRTNRGVHVVGHSFGAKVMLSAVLGDRTRAMKPKSLLLLQPALSHLAFAGALPGSTSPGGYHDVPGLVEQPVFSTCSRWDGPLHDIFHNAVRRAADVGDIRVAAETGAADNVGSPPNKYAALGGYGPKDFPAPTPGLRNTELPPAGTPIVRQAGDLVIGLDGSRERRIDGHMGVANAFTGWALRQQLG
jgi:hypothetical protein